MNIERHHLIIGGGVIAVGVVGYMLMNKSEVESESDQPPMGANTPLTTFVPMAAGSYGGSASDVTPSTVADESTGTNDALVAALMAMATPQTTTTTGPAFDQSAIMFAWMDNQKSMAQLEADTLIKLGMQNMYTEQAKAVINAGKSLQAERELNFSYNDQGFVTNINKDFIEGSTIQQTKQAQANVAVAKSETKVLTQQVQQAKKINQLAKITAPKNVIPPKTTPAKQPAKKK